MAAIFREKVDVDRREVIFIASDLDNLLAAGEAPALVRPVGEVEEVRGVEETFAAVAAVEPLPVVVGEMFVELPVYQNADILALEAAVVLDRVPAQVLPLVIHPGLKPDIHQVTVLCPRSPAYKKQQNRRNQRLFDTHTQLCGSNFR